MKILLYSLLCILAISLTSCEPKTQFNPEKPSVKTAQSDYINTSIDHLDQLIETKPTLKLVDVRTPEEVAAGVIGQPLKINFHDDNFQTKIVRLDKDIPYLVYCKSGGRSAKAAKLMKKAGIKYVYNLQGGYTAYEKSMTK